MEVTAFARLESFEGNEEREFALHNFFPCSLEPFVITWKTNEADVANLSNTGSTRLSQWQLRNTAIGCKSCLTHALRGTIKVFVRFQDALVIGAEEMQL